MRIIIDNEVHLAIENFYRAAMSRHITLSQQTVEDKKNRLYDAIEDLRYSYRIYPKARLRQDWIDAGWQEFICEDFHFAYERTYDSHGGDLIIIHDAVHSLLYH